MHPVNREGRLPPPAPRISHWLCAVFILRRVNISRVNGCTDHQTKGHQAGFSIEFFFQIKCTCFEKYNLSRHTMCYQINWHFLLLYLIFFINSFLFIFCTQYNKSFSDVNKDESQGPEPGLFLKDQDKDKDFWHFLNLIANRKVSFVWILVIIECNMTRYFY